MINLSPKRLLKGSHYQYINLCPKSLHVAITILTPFFGSRCYNQVNGVINSCLLVGLSRSPLPLPLPFLFSPLLLCYLPIMLSVFPIMLCDFTLLSMPPLPPCFATESELLVTFSLERGSKNVRSGLSRLEALYTDKQKCTKSSA